MEKFYVYYTVCISTVNTLTNKSTWQNTTCDKY